MKPSKQVGFSALCFAISSSMFASCYAGEKIVPSKNYVTQKVNTEEVRAISAHSAVDVVYYQSAGAPYAEIYAPDNIVPYVKVSNKNGKLEVEYDFPKGQSLSVKGKYVCEVRVYAPEVTSFHTSSAADLRIMDMQTDKEVSVKASSSGDIKGNKLKCANLSIQTSSAGDIYFSEVDCKKLGMYTSSSGDLKLGKVYCTSSELVSQSAGDCEVDYLNCIGEVIVETSSSGDMELSGKCSKAVLSSSSAGDIDAEDLQADEVAATSSSAGDIKCYAVKTLWVKCSSGGSIRYKGNPQITGKMKGVSKL